MADSGHTETIQAGAALTVPLLQERLLVGRRVVETGRIHISTATEDAAVREALRAERVPVGREVAAAPATREEGGAVLVIPLVEEVPVPERRLVLKEELRVRCASTDSIGERTVPLRRQTAAVERLPARPGADPRPNGRHDGAGDQT